MTVSRSENASILTRRKLFLFKWLMILLPAVVVLGGHSLLGFFFENPSDHSLTGGNRLAENLLVSLLLLVLVYLFTNVIFKVLGRLQAEAFAREQDILVMNAVMRERERLSRDLHDGSAQLVADLLIRLDTIKELVETGRSPEAMGELERLHRAADEIYQDIEESIDGLRSNVAERGLVNALQDYLDQFEERHRLPITLETDAAAGQLPPLAALQIFRLVQEALTNIRKHAGANAAKVTVSSPEAGILRVVIADDGEGFALGSQVNGKTRRLGLTSMRERVEMLGGRFNVDSQAGSGVVITAAIPIPVMKGGDPHAAAATTAG